jgi:hypothetical protein
MDSMIKAFANQVANDGKTKLRSVMKQVAKRVEVDFLEQAQTCLDNYYKEYDPLVYNRTENLRRNGFNPYKRYRRNEIDIGVSFDPSSMDKYRENDTFSEYKAKPYITTREQLVVENAMEGIHGRPSIYVGRSIDDTMQHFTSAYAHWFLDGYFKELISKF